MEWRSYSNAMYSLPFRLLVVNDLDLQVAARSDRHRWQPPGAVEESENQPLWKSKPNTPFPQELGLILLSAQPATIKALRLAVEVARAPAKIVVFAALPPRQGSINALSALDSISRYLSVDWKQCCEPLVWEECSSARLDTARDIDSRTIRLDAPECSFVKLVVHTPHASLRNQSQEVVLDDIELLGFAEASAPTQSLHPVQEDEELMNHRSGVIHRPTLLSLTSDNDELQAVLLDAGVPMDLVAQVASLPNSEAGMLLPSQAIDDTVEVTPESNYEGAAVPDNATLAPPENSSEDRDPASPFDTILRQYVEQTSLERSTLEEILATKICKLTDEVSSWQSPTISPSDPANSNEITLYTFGTFFTQCLLCGGADIQLTCLHMAERTAPLMKKSIGATCAFEGIVALTVLGIREAKSSQVFQAAIHLAHTAFLTDMTIVKKASELVESERGIFPDCTSASAFGLIDEVTCANWSYGLRVILEWTLVSPFCWLINHTGKSTMPSKTIPNGLSRFSSAPPSIDRDFLQFVRLLVEQDLTCTQFFDELLDLTPTGNTAGLTFARNRLRLLRLVVRNDIIRCQVPANVKSSIHTLSTSLLPSNKSTQSAQLTADREDTIVTRLASECLAEIDRSASSSYQNNERANRLTSVRRHLEVSSHAKSHHSHRYSHTAFFIQDPLLDAQVTEFTAQLQRYFVSQPRPHALYRHSFVRASQAASKDEGLLVTRASFQKGNIAFQGEVVARTPPKGTFHEEIEQKSAPFVFDVGDKKLESPHSAGHQEIASNFATFRGTIERRSDPPKRSNKVSPEQHIQAPPASKSTTVSRNSQFGTSVITNTVNMVPSEIPKIPVQDARGLTPIPEIAIANRSSTATNQQPATTPPADDPPSSSIPAIMEQIPTHPESVKHLKRTNKPSRETKAKSKEKPKGKAGKDTDNCVVQ